MNRADLLYSVLKDGAPHSRRDIQERVGFFLTNNAASELRKRGLNVTHVREGRVDIYQLSPRRGGVDGNGLAPLESPPPFYGDEARSVRSPSELSIDGGVQLSFGDAA